MVAKARETKTYSPLPTDSIVIGLDVSTTAVGFAVMRVEPHVSSMEPRRLVLGNLGLYKPKASLDWYARVCELSEWVREAIFQYRFAHISAVVIERSDGATWNTRAARSRSNDTAKVAMAQGAVLAHVYGLVGHDYDLVTSTQWARGKSKADRAKEIALQFPMYAQIKDPGYDVADAIGLCLWRWRKGRESAALNRSGQ